MNKENICFSSKTIELAENENYIELTNRLCYYNEPNLNNVVLIYDEFSNDKAQTLVDMPVVAKYAINSKGEPTFKGHEVYYDEDGNLFFGTDNIGTHIETYIKEDTVVIDKNGTTKVLPCLFAKYRVWKRNQNVVDAIHRLYDLGKLYSSWEIQTISYIFKNGIKTLTDYVFLSNCLLGYENAFPAYGEDAKGISMSQKESQLLVAEAFSKDIIEHSVSDKNENEEVKNMEDTIKEGVIEEVSEITLIVEDTVKSVEVPTITETPTETSALTEFDLRRALRQAIRQAIAEKLIINEWDVCLIYHFPVEKIVWVQNWNSKSELDVTVFSYTVENDVVTVSEPTETKLTVSIAQINTTVAELNSKVEALTDSLVEASTKIQTLNKNVAELTPYKDSFEQAEQVRIEAETATKRELLKKFAIDSKFISETEISSDESIKICIDNVDEKGIKAIIAERFVKSLDVKNETPTIKSVETSSVIETVIPKADIADSDIEISNKNIMKQFLKR